MEGDEGGVLGGLPRSRPRTRSGKRERPAAAAERAAAQAEDLAAAAARKPPAGDGPPPPAPEPTGGGVLGLAGWVVGSGLRIATAVPRELIRRLPRP